MLKKIFDATPDGNLSVAVNPTTGRVYSFYTGDAPLLPEDATLVKVNATFAQFFEEFRHGLYYKDGAFYRSWFPNEAHLYTRAGQPVRVRAKAPESVEHVVMVQIDDQTPFETELADIDEEFVLPEGRHTVRFESPFWGRCTFHITVAPAYERTTTVETGVELPDAARLYETVQKAQEVLQRAGKDITTDTGSLLAALKEMFGGIFRGMGR